MSVLSVIKENWTETAPIKPITVDDIVTAAKGNGGDIDMCAVASGFTKDELENTASDLLMIAVSHRLAELTRVLLEKGLRSGFALDAAVYNRDIGAVNRLLKAGCHPGSNAELVAIRLRETAIAQAIAKKRDELNWFAFRPEF
jgi:hypothetical protein